MALDFLREMVSRATTLFTTLLAPILPYVYVAPVDLSGKRSIVSGANVGIGLETARSLALQGSEVWLLCRNEGKAAKAKTDIIASTGNSNIFVEIVDFSSLKSVRDFVERWSKRPTAGRKVDILVNNAGVSTSSKSTTPEGFEISYAVNHLSAFLLTTLLLNHGDITPTARIIQVSSIAMYRSGALDPCNPNSTDLVGGVDEGGPIEFQFALRLYNRTKALQVVMTRELQTKLANSSNYKNVIVQSCHPGLVKSSIWDRPDGVGRYNGHTNGTTTAVSIFGINSAEGAKTPVFLATSPEASWMNNRGKYWDRRSVKWTPAWMENEALRRQLWKRWEADAEVEASDF